MENIVIRCRKGKVVVWMPFVCGIACFSNEIGGICRGSFDDPLVTREPKFQGSIVPTISGQAIQFLESSRALYCGSNFVYCIGASFPLRFAYRQKLWDGERFLGFLELENPNKNKITPGGKIHALAEIRVPCHITLSRDERKHFPTGVRVDSRVLMLGLRGAN